MHLSYKFILRSKPTDTLLSLTVRQVHLPRNCHHMNVQFGYPLTIQCILNVIHFNSSSHNILQENDAIELAIYLETGNRQMKQFSNRSEYFLHRLLQSRVKT